MRSTTVAFDEYECGLCGNIADPDDEAYHDGYADGKKEALQGLRHRGHARTLTTLEAMAVRLLAADLRSRIPFRMSPEVAGRDRRYLRSLIDRIRALRFALSICG